MLSRQFIFLKKQNSEIKFNIFFKFKLLITLNIYNYNIWYLQIYIFQIITLNEGNRFFFANDHFQNFIQLSNFGLNFTNFHQIQAACQCVRYWSLMQN